ncbi:MAG: PF20097 family protein [Lawsonibacter sp.]|jgi:hypothetical protein
MNCPKCGNEMTFGWMMPRRASANLEWAPGHAQFPLPRKGKVILKPTPPRDTPFDWSEYPAYLCADCKTVLFEFE